jgi:hypothetical protein
MDLDGNGIIDKREVLLGAHMLQIAITARELELIWPMFGPFEKNGMSVTLDSFIEKFSGRRKLVVDSHTHKAMDLVQVSGLQASSAVVSSVSHIH